MSPLLTANLTEPIYRILKMAKNHDIIESMSEYIRGALIEKLRKDIGLFSSIFKALGLVKEQDYLERHGITVLREA